MAQILSIAAKIKYNYICLFFPQSEYLKITVVNAISAIIFFLIVVAINPQLLFLHIVLTNTIMLFYSEWQYKSTKNPYYHEICST